MQKHFRENPIVETCFFEFSQPAGDEKIFGGNTVTEPSFPDKKKTVAETSFDWNLIFSSKNEKTKKQYILKVGGWMKRQTNFSKQNLFFHI
jgi:hypothetical protein